MDGLDYLVWAAHYGDNPLLDPPGAPKNGDYNGDGVVDGLDYIVWASGYGRGASAGLALERAAHDVVLASDDDGDATFELAAGGRLLYDHDNAAGVTAAVDAVFERSVNTRRRRPA